MVNLIGAFIVSICLLAILINRPSLGEGEKNLASASRWIQSPLIVFFLLLFTHRAFNCFSGTNIITIPDFVLSTATLWIHEAGHVYWGWDGEILHSFGGTLNEILFPLIPTVICFKQKYYRLAMLFLYWLGYNCIGISRYIGDARTQKLPLLGGGTHDWNIILSRLDLLDYDRGLSQTVWLIGFFSVAAALLLYTRFMIKIPQSEANNRN